ncbi:DUF6262 family protein [Paraburkholderia sp. A1RO-5]|uniref:DUF6262 family protein n=1 Tax=Paraburkholderia sp. A1RO-5 TaxID=3028369 RepID=UPI003B8047E3
MKSLRLVAKKCLGRSEVKNGRDVGREHFATLQAFVKSGSSVPVGRDGAVNISELARVTGIPKSSFYQNPDVRSLIATLRDAGEAEPAEKDTQASEEAIVSSSLVHMEAQQTQRLEGRVNSLEQQNAILVAENAELRRQLRDLRQQLARQDMMIDTGKRVVRPPEE